MGHYSFSVKLRLGTNNKAVNVGFQISARAGHRVGFGFSLPWCDWSLGGQGASPAGLQVRPVASCTAATNHNGNREYHS
jgi:hypothetical protein